MGKGRMTLLDVKAIVKELRTKILGEARYFFFWHPLASAFKSAHTPVRLPFVQVFA